MAFQGNDLLYIMMYMVMSFSSLLQHFTKSIFQRNISSMCDEEEEEQEVMRRHSGEAGQRPKSVTGLLTFYHSVFYFT